MSYLKQMKIENEILEKKLRELKLAMEKEKEERRQNGNCRWRSSKIQTKSKVDGDQSDTQATRPSDKVQTISKIKYLHENEQKSPQKPTKKKDIPRKIVETRTSLDQDNHQFVDLYCVGSSLHNRPCSTQTEKSKVDKLCQDCTEEVKNKVEIKKNLTESFCQSEDQKPPPVEIFEKSTNTSTVDQSKLNRELHNFIDLLLHNERDISGSLRDLTFEQADISGQADPFLDQQKKVDSCYYKTDDDNNTSSWDQEQIGNINEVDRLRIFAIETARKKVGDVGEKNWVKEPLSCFRNQIEVVDLGTFPYDAGLNSQIVLSPVDDASENKMYGQMNQQNRLMNQTRPRFVVTPIFKTETKQMPRSWTNSSLSSVRLSPIDSSLNMRSPSPRPVNKKYRHIQSKVAQAWQSSSPMPAIPRRDEVPVIKKGKSRPKIQKMLSIGDEDINKTIEMHMQRLSPMTPSTPQPEELPDTSDFAFEDFGIKDFLTVDANRIDDNIAVGLTIEEDIGKSLETKPPKIIDCHDAEMIGIDNDNLVDEVRTPSPPPEMGLDGFPEDCMIGSRINPDKIENEELSVDDDELSSNTSTTIFSHSSNPSPEAGSAS